MQITEADSVSSLEIGILDTVFHRVNFATTKLSPRSRYVNCATISPYEDMTTYDHYLSLNPGRRCGPASAAPAPFFHAKIQFLARATQISTPLSTVTRDELCSRPPTYRKDAIMHVQLNHLKGQISI
jgi:hypothetical protein